MDALELSQLSPEALVAFVAQWQPPGEHRVEPEVVSYEGLAKSLTEVVTRDPDRYQEQIASLVLLRPEYAYALLDHFRDPGEGQSVPWEMAIRLCEDLLANITLGATAERRGYTDWISVRMAVVRLLAAGLHHQERSVPDDLLGRVRDLLLILIDDPDPDPESDHPPKGWLGYNDPATTALNRVRPAALQALIEYARRVAFASPAATQRDVSEGPGPERLEAVVREALTRKLDREMDPSWALHSVYGQYLPLLYWLDQAWLESHIGDILSMAEDERSTWYFVAAWEAFVVQNPFYPSMLPLMLPHYEHAIDNLARGFVTETHLQPESHLAWHLALEYLFGDYDLRSAAGRDSLIVRYYAKVQPENRGKIAGALWRICSSNPDARDRWPKTRALWEWRVQAATEAEHSTDYDDEMQHLAQLLTVMPAGVETISTVWPLLEAFLPHITRPEFPNLAWVETEKYLASEVGRDPVKAIQFYRLMHDQLVGPLTHYGEEARTILETTAASKAARPEALSLIDSLGRFGDYRFRDIYERYAR